MNKIKLLITISLLFFIVGLTLAKTIIYSPPGPIFEDGDGNNEFIQCYHENRSTGKIDQYDAVNASMGQQCPEDFHGEPDNGTDNPDCLYYEGR